MTRTVAIYVFAMFTVLGFAKEPSIGVSEAASFEIVSTEKIDQGENEYVFSCAASKPKTIKARAQTMVSVIMALAEDYPGMRIALYLAPDKRLCHEGRLLGTGHYNPDGTGWKSISNGRWSWYLRTTNDQITEQQIADTALYETMKPEFKKKYGVYEYSDKLDEYVEQELGRPPSYVTSGLWVDKYFVE